jgi:hypothetical protein
MDVGIPELYGFGESKNSKKHEMWTNLNFWLVISVLDGDFDDNGEEIARICWSFRKKKILEGFFIFLEPVEMREEDGVRVIYDRCLLSG